MDNDTVDEFMNALKNVKEKIHKCPICGLYTENDVCFEDCKTAEAILLNNDGSIIHSNFNDEKNKYFQDYLKRLYPVITTFYKD